MSNNAQFSDEFKRIASQTREDLDSLSQKFTTVSEKAFNEKFDFNKRLKTIGNVILCALLSHDTKGYSIDNAGITNLKDDIQSEFGINLEQFVKSIKMETVKTFLLSDYMKDYIITTVDENGKLIFRGKPFENELLDELLEHQKIGYNSAKEKENQKMIDRRIRMEASKVSPEAVEGRIRIYKIIDKIGGRFKYVLYQTVQDEYAKVYSTPLNKTEIKKYFGTSETLKALRDLEDDLSVFDDPEQSGSIYLMLKRDLKEIKADYAKKIEELNSFPTISELRKQKPKSTVKTSSTSPQERTKTEKQSSSKTPSPVIEIKSPSPQERIRSIFTQAEGKYSSDESDDESL